MTRRLGLWAVAAVVSLAAGPTHASPFPGATYRGTAATGGTVGLEVSADGSGVTRFVARDVPSSCGGTISKSFTGSLPIVNDAFSSHPADSIRFEGSSPSRGQAAGTLLEASCAGAPVTWTAATDATTAPPPDTTAPALDVRAPRVQRLRRGGRVRVRAGCPDEPCRATAGGAVSVDGAKPRKSPLKGASAELPRGGIVRLEPKLGRRAIETAQRAQGRGRRVRVGLTISAVDSAGNRAVRRLSIRLRPRD